MRYRITTVSLIVMVITTLILVQSDESGAVLASQPGPSVHPIYNPTGDVNTILNNAYYTWTDSATLKVSEYLNMTDAELRNLLDTSGRDPSLVGNGDGINIQMVYITYDLALLYHLTGDTTYAHKAAVLLDRYADVFPYWPKDNEVGQRGIWSSWFHQDLDVARRLAEAYDLIYNSSAFEGISGDTKDKVKDLLIQIIQADFNQPLYLFNVAGTRPLGIIVFGRILEDPELTHLGYWYYNRIIHEYYCYDGFMSEGSYHYSRLLTVAMTNPDYSKLVREIANPDYNFYLDGYSDPPGYTHVPFDVRWDPVRIDNYDVNSRFLEHWERMWDILYDTAFPDNTTWPVLNDGSPTNYGNAKYRDPASPSESMLMGGIGHAILAWGSGATQTQVRLDFSHAVGHAHFDANHLIYYDKGTEVVGGTGYREGDRAWNTSTINQNLVVVNEQEQKWNYFIDKTISPYIPGSPRNPVTRELLRSNTNLHNNLVLFEPGYQSFKEVQVAEVDTLNAYDNVASRYQRMLGLVHISGDDVYLVDFFRLKGSTQYNWNMHGGHTNYSLSTDLTMTNTTETLGDMSLTHKSDTSNTWSSILDYGTVKHKITMAGKQGTTVYKGTGLQSINNPGYQDYVSAKRITSEDTDEDFLVVHETYNTSPHIQSIEELQFVGDSATAVGLKITLDNGMTDYVIHTLDEGPVYPEHTVAGINNFRLKGRFAHVRTTNGKVTWMKLIQGESLSFDTRTMTSTIGDYSYRGNITKVNRKEEGASENSFEVDTTLPADGSLDNKTLIVKWGNGWTWGYKIKTTTTNKIITDEEPGFHYGLSQDPGIYMQYFPVPEYLGLTSFPGPVSFKIAGSAVMDESGNVIATGPTYRPNPTYTPTPTYTATPLPTSTPTNTPLPTSTPSRTMVRVFLPFISRGGVRGG